MSRGSRPTDGHLVTPHAIWAAERATRSRSGPPATCSYRSHGVHHESGVSLRAAGSPQRAGLFPPKPLEAACASRHDAPRSDAIPRWALDRTEPCLPRRRGSRAVAPGDRAARRRRSSGSAHWGDRSTRAANARVYHYPAKGAWSARLKSQTVANRGAQSRPGRPTRGGCRRGAGVLER